MTTVLAFVFMLVVVTGMAIGVIFGRRPIEGSCGGMGRLGLDTACEICGGDRSRCPEEAAESTKHDLGRDAMANPER